jgi:hypothetical protein
LLCTLFPQALPPDCYTTACFLQWLLTEKMIHVKSYPLGEVTPEKISTFSCLKISRGIFKMYISPRFLREVTDFCFKNWAQGCARIFYKASFSQVERSRKMVTQKLFILPESPVKVAKFCPFKKLHSGVFRKYNGATYKRWLRRCS